jgi:hypothetical protein
MRESALASNRFRMSNLKYWEIVADTISAAGYIRIRARLKARSAKRNGLHRCSSIRTYVLRLRGGIGSDRGSTSRNSSHCFQTGTGGV